MAFGAFFTAVPGTVAPVVRLNLDCPAFIVQNDSVYDVWVKVGGEPPAVVPGPLGTAAYDWAVLAGCHEPVQTPQPFDGNVYCGVFNPAGSAASGTTSSRANVYIIPLSPGQNIPDGFSSPRALDLSSQPRVISLPITATLMTSGVRVITTPVLPQPIGFFATGWTSDGITHHAATLYVYAVHVSILGVRWAALELGLGWADVTASPAIATTVVNLVDGIFHSGQGPAQLMAAVPSAGLITSDPAHETVGHTYTFSLNVLVRASYPVLGAPITCTLHAAFQISTDASAQVPPLPPGQGAGQPSGVVY